MVDEQLHIRVEKILRHTPTPYSMARRPAPTVGFRIPVVARMCNGLDEIDRCNGGRNTPPAKRTPPRPLPPARPEGRPPRPPGGAAAAPFPRLHRAPPPAPAHTEHHALPP